MERTALAKFAGVRNTLESALFAERLLLRGFRRRRRVRMSARKCIRKTAIKGVYVIRRRRPKNNTHNGFGADTVPKKLIGNIWKSLNVKNGNRLSGQGNEKKPKRKLIIDLESALYAEVNTKHITLCRKPVALNVVENLLMHENKTEYRKSK